MQENKRTKKNKKGQQENLIKEKTLTEIKSIKIPENIIEREKLSCDLRLAVTEIDMEIENLKLRKDYYLEILYKVNSDLEKSNQSIYKYISCVCVCSIKKKSLSLTVLS